jgi:hypothetical protein
LCLSLLFGWEFAAFVEIEFGQFILVDLRLGRFGFGQFEPLWVEVNDHVESLDLVRSIVGQAEGLAGQADFDVFCESGPAFERSVQISVLHQHFAHVQDFFSVKLPYDVAPD